MSDAAAAPKGVRRAQHRWSRFIAGTRCARGLAELLGALALVAAIAAWALLRAEQQRLVDLTMRSKAEALRTMLRERTVIHEFPLRRLAYAWGRYGEPARAIWDAEAREIVLEDSFRAVALVDSSLVVRRVTARGGVSALVAGMPLTDPDRRAAADEARARRWSFSTGAVDVGRGVPGRSTIVPVLRGDTLVGYVIGEMEAAAWLRYAIAPAERAGFALTLRSRAHVIEQASDPSPTSGASNEIDLGDAPLAGAPPGWQLRVTALAPVVSGVHAAMPAAVLAIGVAIAILLWLAVRLAQQAAGRAHEHARATRRLEHEIIERERAQATLGEREEELRQAQKMEAVGRLAGGVAHDFNNLLTAISGHAEFLIADLERGDPRRDDAREIKKAATRAASLTSQLLAFSRRQIRQPKSLDLNHVVADLERMLRRLIGEDIRLASAFGENLGSVHADPGQLEQIIVNLVLNASDAMPTGGTISLATRAVIVDAALAARQRGLHAGPYVRLDVTDTGSGMDEATRQQIFEPFFTTKQPGKGTGLGLSMVYAIVESSLGAIAVESARGVGTTFTIWLPRHDAPAESFVSGTYLRQAPGGTETVLLAEDEAGVRHLAARVLEAHGYRVIQATNGRLAIAAAAAHAGSIDLLITDVVMPEMGGKELAATLGARRAEMRVLFVSGYTDGEISRRGELDPDTAFLQKPFTAPMLLSKVREVLDASSVATL